MTAISSPPLRAPMARAAPSAPVAEKARAPTAAVRASRGNWAGARPRLIPTGRVMAASGRPRVSQWASALSATTPSSGRGPSASRSSVPSSKSRSNNRSSVNKLANESANQTSPGAKPAN